MPVRTIAKLRDTTSPEDSLALDKLMKQKELIVSELQATKAKLDTAVALGDTTIALEHASNASPEDVELHVKNRIAQILSVDSTTVKFPEALDDLTMIQLTEIWDAVRGEEVEADHVLDK